MYIKDSKRDCKQLDILEPLVGLLTVACSCLFLYIASVSRLDCFWQCSVLATRQLCFPSGFHAGLLRRASQMLPGSLIAPTCTCRDAVVEAVNQQEYQLITSWCLCSKTCASSVLSV